jgi:hypothetical protein
MDQRHYEHSKFILYYALHPKPYSKIRPMTFGEEITQLLLIIGVLLLILIGVSFWTKRGGSINMPSMGSKSSDATGMVDTGIDDGSAEFMSEPGQGKSSGGTKTSADLLNERFELTGKDAENAARVLRGMLKKDEHFKNRSEK